MGLSALVPSAPHPSVCPGPPKKAHGYYSDIYLDDVIATPDGFTKWDQVTALCRAPLPTVCVTCGARTSVQTVITGNLTLRDFLATYTEQTGLTVMALRHPSADVPKQAKCVAPCPLPPVRLCSTPPSLPAAAPLCSCTAPA